MEKLISHVLLKDQLFFESHRENAFGFFFLNQIVSTSCQKCELSQLQERKLAVPFTEHILTQASGQQSIKMPKRPRSISMKNCFISVWASCSDNDLPKRSLAICYHSHRKMTSKQNTEQAIVVHSGAEAALLLTSYWLRTENSVRWLWKEVSEQTLSRAPCEAFVL